MTLSLKKRKSEERPEIPVLRADPELGLTAEQAEERRQLGYANAPVSSPVFGSAAQYARELS